MAGRRPQPSALKVLRGNPGKRALPDEPKPRLLEFMPDPPEWLDDYAKEKWPEGDGLVRCGILTEADVDVWVSYCMAWSDLRHASEDVQREGRTYVNDKGDLKRSPTVLTLESAKTAFVRIAQEFGVTPAARSKVERLEAPEGEVPGARFLDR